MKNVIFTFNGINIIIQCNKEDTIKGICNKFANKIGLDINLIFFLYNGMQLNLELNQQINNLGRDKNEINILAYEKYKSTIIMDGGIGESKEIICPKCKENCKIKINTVKPCLITHRVRERQFFGKGELSRVYEYIKKK